MYTGTLSRGAWSGAATCLLARNRRYISAWRKLRFNGTVYCHKNHRSEHPISDSPSLCFAPPPTKTIILGTVYFKRLSRKSKGFYQFPGFYTRFTSMSWRVNGRRRSEEVGTLHSAPPFIALSAADWAAALARNDSRGFSPSAPTRPAAAADDESYRRQTSFREHHKRRVVPGTGCRSNNTWVVGLVNLPATSAR